MTCLVSFPKNSTEVLQLKVPDGLEISRQLPQYVIFEQDPNSEWVRVSRLSPNREAAVLVRADEANTTLNSLLPIASKIDVRKMRPGLEALSLIRLTTRSFGKDDLAGRPELLNLVSHPGAYLRLTGGLRAAGLYLPPIPPSVMFSAAGVNEAEVLLDGESIGIAKRERNFLLPAGLGSGRHIVSIAGGELEFEVADFLVASQLDYCDDDAIGYEVSRPGNLMRAVPTPGAGKLAEYRSTQVLLVVGGVLA
jgi:hypothetical protein